MASQAETIWSQVLPEVRNGVTGVGVWAALNACRAVALEEGVLVLGLDHSDSELSGHLRVPSTRRLLDELTAKAYGKPLKVRIIDGTTDADWETAKRRDAEARRLQEQALAKARAEISARSNWDSVYEQIGRLFAGIPNKSLPQNRARFLEQSIHVLAEAKQNQPSADELAERNFARCLERVAQYAEVPSALLASMVLKEVGEL